MNIKDKIKKAKTIDDLRDIIVNECYIDQYINYKFKVGNIHFEFRSDKYNLWGEDFCCNLYIETKLGYDEFPSFYIVSLIDDDDPIKIEAFNALKPVFGEKLSIFLGKIAKVYSLRIKRIEEKIELINK